MAVELRLVLDRVGEASEAGEVQGELVRALRATRPQGCDVSAIVPSDAPDLREVAGPLADVRRVALGRRALAASWRMGVPAGAGGGLIHAASLAAPLVRHDRVHDHDQTVVSLWDLSPWERPDGLPRPERAARDAELRRAQRHADAVVVPAHALVPVLARHAPRLAGRARVIAGAPPAGFAVPTDAVGRRRALGVPDGAAVVAAARTTDAEVAAGLAAARGAASDVVVLDVPGERVETVRRLAAEAGWEPERVRVLGMPEPRDRAALLGEAPLLIAPSTAPAFPWRAVEALAVGTVVVAAHSPVHAEVLLDGAVLAGADLAGPVTRALEPDALRRLAVQAADRGRTFSWRDHAERVWALHAEL